MITWDFLVMIRLAPPETLHRVTYGTIAPTKSTIITRRGMAGHDWKKSGTTGWKDSDIERVG